MSKFTIGVPRERKPGEGRVGMTPDGVRYLLKLFPEDLSIKIESGAGSLAGFGDDDYLASGAVIVFDQKNLYTFTDLVVKVKEPTPEEYPYLKLIRGKTLFTYLHLAGVDPRLTQVLLEEEITGVAYEGVQVEDAHRQKVFPLLVPMSKIAGRVAVEQAVAMFPYKAGLGNLHFVMLGAGTVGQAAVRKALQLGSCFISVFEPDPKRIQSFSDEFRVYLGGRVHIHPLPDLRKKIGRNVRAQANIIISGVMLPGGKAAPKVLSHGMLRRLTKGTHIMDVAIDQGGSTAWSQVTKPGDTYEDRGIVFSCVPNIPATVPHEATLALTEATLQYISLFAGYALAHGELGVEKLLKDRGDLRAGLQTWEGKLTNQAVAEKHRLTKFFVSLDALF